MFMHTIWHMLYYKHPIQKLKEKINNKSNAKIMHPEQSKKQKHSKLITNKKYSNNAT